MATSGFQIPLANESFRTPGAKQNRIIRKNDIVTETLL